MPIGLSAILGNGLTNSYEIPMDFKGKDKRAFVAVAITN